MTKSTLNYLDTYCERASSIEIFAEPVNFITNFAFIIAAYFSYKIFKQKNLSAYHNVDIIVLIFLLVAISIGSALWHLKPNNTTLLTDIIPIILFVNIFLISILYRVFSLNYKQILLLWLIFQATTYLFEISFSRDTLNGTIMYVPTYITLISILYFLHKKCHITVKFIAYATIIWSCSLFLRTVDIHSCSYTSIGTHSLWHMLNSMVLYYLIKSLIYSTKSPYIRKHI